jgi:hypothetical protein
MIDFEEERAEEEKEKSRKVQMGYSGTAEINSKTLPVGQESFVADKKVEDGMERLQEQEDDDEAVVLSSMDSQRSAFEFMSRVDGLISSMRAESGLQGGVSKGTPLKKKESNVGKPLTMEELRAAAKARMEVNTFTI